MGYTVSPRTAEAIRRMIANGGSTGQRGTSGSAARGMTWCKITDAEADEDGWCEAVVSLDVDGEWSDLDQPVLVYVGSAVVLADERHPCTRTGDGDGGIPRFRLLSVGDGGGGGGLTITGANWYIVRMLGTDAIQDSVAWVNDIGGMGAPVLVSSGTGPGDSNPDDAIIIACETPGPVSGEAQPTIQFRSAYHGTYILVAGAVNVGDFDEPYEAFWVSMPGERNFVIYNHSVGGSSGANYAVARIADDLDIILHIGVDGTLGDGSTVTGGIITAIAGSGSGDTPAIGPAPTEASELTAEAGDGQITWSWTTVSGASSYQLQTAADSGFTTGLVTINPATSPYVETGLTNGVIRYGRVSGVNNSAAGPYGYASATPAAEPTPGVGLEQATSDNFIESATPRSIAFEELVTSGHLLVVAVATWNTGITVEITDSAEHTWTQIAGTHTSSSGNVRVSLWYTIADVSDTLPVEVTVTPSAAAYMAIAVSEWRGATTPVLDSGVGFGSFMGTLSTPVFDTVASDFGTLIISAWAHDSDAFCGGDGGLTLIATQETDGASTVGLVLAYNMSPNPVGDQCSVSFATPVDEGGLAAVGASFTPT